MGGINSCVVGDAMKITEQQRLDMALEMIEEISTYAQSQDPKRDWKESQEAVWGIYGIIHSIRSPWCRKNHPKWCRKIDDAIRDRRKS